jgi:hypothetical protein
MAITNPFPYIVGFFDHFLLILGGVPRHLRNSNLERHTHNSRFWRGCGILLGSLVGSAAIASFWFSDYFWFGFIGMLITYWIVDTVLMVTWNGKKWGIKAIPIIGFRILLSLGISLFSTTVVMLYVFSADVQKTVATEKELQVAPWRQQITDNTNRIRGERQARVSAVEASIREVDVKIAEAGANPCEGMTRRRACEAATSAAAASLVGLNTQKAQLATDLQSAKADLQASSTEVTRTNAPIQVRIDEVMNRTDGGLADKTATLDKVKVGREIQFWAIYLIVFVFEFLGFIAKIAQTEDTVDIAVVTQNVISDHNMQVALGVAGTNTPPTIPTNTASAP